MNIFLVVNLALWAAVLVLQWKQSKLLRVSKQTDCMCHGCKNAATTYFRFCRGCLYTFTTGEKRDEQ